MTRIIYELGGKAPAVVLTQSDKDQIKTALRSVNVGEFVKGLDINRTHLYSLLKQDKMELLRFNQLCKALNLQLLSTNDLDNFIKVVEPFKVG